MNKNPLVSIVTPCYNASKYIGIMIESVKAQSYINWELLIVDDHSTDNSCSVIKEYISNDNRIKLLQTNQNTGSPAEPRNIGINNSKGSFIALLDADDLWYPLKLEEQLKTIAEKECDIVYSNGDIINEKGEKIRSMNKTPWVDYRRTLKRNELSCSSVLIRKEVIGNIKFQNIPKEDFVFWLELMRTSGEKAYNTNKSHYAYRLVANSRSRNKYSIVQQQWNVLRNIEKLSLMDSIYCFACWATRNVKKYYI